MFKKGIDGNTFGVLVDMKENKMYFFIDGVPQTKHTTYFEEKEQYFPAFCTFNGTIELTNHFPKKLPRELIFLLEWSKESHNCFPKSFRDLVYTMLKFQKRFNSQNKFPIPKDILFIIFKLIHFTD